MIGGLKILNRYSRLAAAGLFVGGVVLAPAHSADLGGDCCADLEERVAELEATTVRKGNRKVSLQLSGQVNTALLIWDDGDETDVYIVDNENSNTRFRMKGKAKIKPGWTAGYLLELDVDGNANSSNVDQNDDDGSGVQGDILELRHSDIYIKSPYGKFSLGQGNSASNGTSEVDLSGTTVAGYSGLTDIGSSFQYSNAGTGALTGVTLGATFSNLDGLSRNNRIRYDSPTLAGFIFSTSFGEDDQWDVVLRYKNKFDDFKIAAAISYAENAEVTAPADDDEIVNGSVSIFHIPTGLNFTFAAGDREDEQSLEQTFFYGKVGLKRRYNSLGTTAIAFAYGYGDEFDAAGGEFDHFGIQVVQKVDAAAMELFFAYSHNEYEDDSATDYDDLDFFLIGSRIKF